MPALGRIVRLTRFTISLIALVVAQTVVVAGPAEAATVRDIAARTGLLQVAHTWSANVADYDSDGFPDLLLVRHREESTQLFRNTGRGLFVLTWILPKADRHDCAWGDPNLDGRPDAYCSVGAHRGFGEGPKELWIQQAGGSFANHAVEWGIVDEVTRGRWATFLDVNNDGRPDLFAGARPRPDGAPAPNRLWLNQGSAFTDSPSHGVNNEVGNLCVREADYDADGWVDLVVCGEYRLFLYRNQVGASFDDATASVGVSTAKALSARFADLNKDGRVDLVLAYANALRIQLQTASHTFAAPITVSTLDGIWDTATADFDGDGDQDIYLLRTGTKPDRIYRNNGTGTTYATLLVPQPSTVGSGNTVEPLNHNSDSRTEFIVLNGEDTSAGSVQLIAWE